MMDATGSVTPVDAESAMHFMLLQLLYPLIDHPEECSVEVVRRDGAAMFSVCVAPDDLEKLTGRNARTGPSLQVIVGAVGAKSRRRFSLTFREEAVTGDGRPAVQPEIAGRCSEGL